MREYIITPYSLSYSLKMLNGNPLQLGKLQQRILKHMFECNGHGGGHPYESVNHIAKALGAAQPTIFKSVRLLIKDNYLISQKVIPLYGKRKLFRSFGGIRELYLTDKGAATAVILGVTYSQFEYSYSDIYDYIDHNPGKKSGYGGMFRLDDTVILEYIRKIIKPHPNQNLILRKAMEYALENNLFEEGRFRRLTPDEIKKFGLFVALEYIDSSGDILTLKQFVNKYGIDKSFLRRYLERQKLYLESTIHELG
jgi:hypothetical protein